MKDGEFMKLPLITSQIHREWKNFPAFFQKKQDDSNTQLKELTSYEMLVTTFPNLSTLAKTYLTIPVSTASVE